MGLLHGALEQQQALTGPSPLLHTQGTASTLTRSEVRGGGKKPYKQKGTGNARRGSSTSPLFPGGGVTFGPKVSSSSRHGGRQPYCVQQWMFTREHPDKIYSNMLQHGRTRWQQQQAVLGW
jgi:hypothetical protein